MLPCGYFKWLQSVFKSKALQLAYNLKIVGLQPRIVGLQLRKVSLQLRIVSLQPRIVGLQLKKVGLQPKNSWLTT